MESPLLLISDIIEKGILVILVGLSIWSIAIIFDLRKTFKNEFRLGLQNAKELIRGKKNSGESGLLAAAVEVFVKAKAVNPATVSRYQGEVREQKLRLEKGLSILATLGANSPFVGLLGTVLGIIRAFSFLGSQTGQAAVISGVSQALVATAVGLVVAIPAVTAYNYFSKKLRDLVAQAEILKDYALSLEENSPRG
jgi:biopolymer transport protein ExbB/TolQ